MLHFYAITHLLSYGMCFMALILAVLIYRRSQDKLVKYQAFALVGASFFLLAQFVDLYMAVGRMFKNSRQFESFFVIFLYLSVVILFYVIPRLAYLMADRPFSKILRRGLYLLSLTFLCFLTLWITLGDTYRQSLLANVVLMLSDLLMVFNLAFLALFLWANRHRIHNPEAGRLAKSYVWVFLVALPFYGFEVYLCATEFIKVSYHFIFTPFMLFFWNLVNLLSLTRRLSQAGSTGRSLDISVLKEFGLTNREQEVADLLFMKHSYKEISEKLGISIPTVKTHIQNIYQKMDVTCRAEMYERLKETS